MNISFLENMDWEALRLPTKCGLFALRNNKKRVIA